MAKNKVLVNSKERTLRLVQLAMLAALEVILMLFYIPIGIINLNFGLVPIVVAAICISPAAGAFIGAVSGFVTMIQVLTTTGNPFYVFLVLENPVAACILCLVKTTAAGLIIGLLYRAFKKHRTGSVLASLLCPIINTGIFALGMLTIFADGLLNDPLLSTLGNGIIAIVFVGLIGPNFFVECALNLLICPVLTRTLLKTRFFK